MKFAFFAALVVTSSFPSNGARADTDFSALGREAYALWDCASFGFISQPDAELSAKLFEQGRASMNELLVARRDGKLTSENSKDIPIGLGWWLIDGPSIEFSLGFMWANFSSHAFDETYDEYLDGTFDQKKELQKLKAAQEFQDKNCQLLAD